MGGRRSGAACGEDRRWKLCSVAKTAGSCPLLCQTLSLFASKIGVVLGCRDLAVEKNADRSEEHLPEHEPPPPERPRARLPRLPRGGERQLFPAGPRTALWLRATTARASGAPSPRHQQRQLPAVEGLALEQGRGDSVEQGAVLAQPPQRVVVDVAQQVGDLPVDLGCLLLAIASTLRPSPAQEDLLPSTLAEEALRRYSR